MYECAEYDGKDLKFFTNIMIVLRINCNCEHDDNNNNFICQNFFLCISSCCLFIIVVISTPTHTHTHIRIFEVEQLLYNSSLYTIK